MAIYSTTFDGRIVQALNNGGVGVVRTDTLYGIVARARDERAVERMYDIKRRTPSKSPILLIASLSQLFDTYDQATTDQLNRIWPGKNSIILPSNDGPAWITRGNASIAYRIPDNENLRSLLRQTGPLIAPSANPEGQPPARSIEEAERYFGDSVDFYVDGGKVTDDSPSRLYRLGDDTMERLR